VSRIATAAVAVPVGFQNNSSSYIGNSRAWYTAEMLKLLYRPLLALLGATLLGIAVQAILPQALWATFALLGAWLFFFGFPSFMDSKEARESLDEPARKRWREWGRRAIVIMTVVVSLLVFDFSTHREEKAREKARDAERQGALATEKKEADQRGEIARLEKKLAITDQRLDDLTARLTKRLKKEHPDAKQVKPLSQSPGVSNQFFFAEGKITLRLILESADAQEWLYRIDTFDFRGTPEIHDRGSEIHVHAGALAVLVAGKDASLVASVITLGNGQKIPWVGLLTSPDRPRHAIYNLPSTSLMGENQ